MPLQSGKESTLKATIQQSDDAGTHGLCARGRILFQDSEGNVIGSLDGHKELPDTIGFRGSAYLYSGVMDGQGIYTLVVHSAEI